MQRATLSANRIFEIAPVGAIISWCNGKSCPPPSDYEAWVEWHRENQRGLLVRKNWRPIMGQPLMPIGFKVMIGGPRFPDDVIPRKFRTFALDGDHSFDILERPAIRAYRVFDRCGEDAELVHLAACRYDAEIWVRKIAVGPIFLNVVTADEIAADVVEGRAAA
ncbi:hypothetical protein ACQKGC_25400 [Allorhizobium pseudoryzae]|uniref:hypothetical protein n=1 Tax=Allorhizobium pseudoryzae TaxID=379684 RepID=UPI003D000CA9